MTDREVTGSNPVLELQEELALAVRAQIRRQKLLWQKVPYLALNTEHVTTRGPGVEYRYGIWRPFSGNLYEPGLPYVDCASGELVQIVNRLDVHRAATTAEVLLILGLDKFAQYDAHTLIAHLESRATGPGYAYCTSVGNTKDSLLKDFGHIAPVYTRVVEHLALQ